MKSEAWEFARKEDGTFDIFHQGKLLDGSIPDEWLANQLGHYGFCGQEYADIRRQLDQFGSAKIVV